MDEMHITLMKDTNLFQACVVEQTNLLWFICCLLEITALIIQQF
jgi:hypothetical protein